jgi:hypothetical protein
VKNSAPVFPISYPPAPSKGRRVKRFLLCGALLFALLNPLPAAGQGLTIEVRAWPLDSENAPQHLNYQVCNYQNDTQNSPIDVFELSGLKIWVDYDRFQTPAGWQGYITAEDSIAWIADDGNEIWPGACKDRFIVFSPTTDWMDGIDYLVAGENGVAWGQTWGHQQ